MKFLREWLRLWHGGRYQGKNDSSCRHKGDIQGDDDDYDCSHCDYDSEDTTEEGFLENVLLITGPIGVRDNLLCQNCGIHFVYINWLLYSSSMHLLKIIIIEKMVGNF